MYPLGHIGTALIAAAFLSMPAAAFVLGVMLPDIIDKGLAILNLIDCGRSWAHNVFFAVGAGLVALAVTRNKKVALAIGLGAILHLVGDSTHFVPYLYPLVQYDFGECGPVQFQPGAFEVTMEAVGLALIIVWWRFRSKLFYLRERIIKSRRFKRVFG